MKRKWLAVGIILLFIGLTIAPTINFNTVKASTDDDLVEVTTQACGIQEYGNTTVKLTREQYQNLESYLVEFRTRLNQTTTREEAVPIFKDAIVELNRYGLLPKEMTIAQAQCLMLGDITQGQKISRIFNTSSIYDNMDCFIIGCSYNGNTIFQPLRNKILYNVFHWINTQSWIPSFIIFLDILFELYTWGLLQKNPSPIKIGSLIHYGGHVNDIISGHSETYYGEGFVWTIGLHGLKLWDGSLIGHLSLKIPFEFSLAGVSYKFYCGAIGFTGLRLFLNSKTFYFGFALAVNLDETNK